MSHPTPHGLEGRSTEPPLTVLLALSASKKFPENNFYTLPLKTKKGRVCFIMPGTWPQQKRWRKKHRDLYLASKTRNNQRRAKRRQEFINSYKATHPCVCGETDISCLDFHHRNPAKKDFPISQKASITKIKIEIKKCEVMCANCHRKGHAGRPRPEHKTFFK
jgi:hypothetical protein